MNHRITKVVRFADGMVMAFDQAGQQLLDYQGHADLVKARVLRDAPIDTAFIFQKGMIEKPVDREQFFGKEFDL